MKKLVYGIGVNDADYVVQPKINGIGIKCKFYASWHSMFVRCYSKNYQINKPTYIGCTVATEWHKFSNFKSWMENQDWQEKQLDKDLLQEGNKIYSESTCIFISPSLNLLMTDRFAKRGLHPIGVSFHARDEVYQSYVRRNGVIDHLGYFSSPILAHKEWQKAKSEIIEQAANEQTDSRIKNALMLRVKKLRDDLANGRETVKL